MVNEANYNFRKLLELRDELDDLRIKVNASRTSTKLEMISLKVEIERLKNA